MAEADKFIDIDKIFKQKNPKIYKWIPGFLMKYIKRITHQDDINRFQESAKNKFEYEYLDAALIEIGVNITYTGLENIPPKGSIVVCSNHPLGGADGMAIMQVVARVRRDVRFLVNDLLSNLKNFGTLFFGVNKVGNTMSTQLKQIDDLYAQENAVVIFPAGLVSRPIDGKVQDLEWSKSFITKAVKYNKLVIPVHIKGKLSNFFYGLYKFRNKVGIKAKLEMFYLINEMYKQNDKNVHIKIGKPIQPSYFDKRFDAKKWASLMREYIYFLENNDLSFDEYLIKQKII